MENQKVQKTFIQRHKKAITVVGVGVLAAASVYGALYIYRRAFMTGAVAGYHVTIDWLDKEFPDIKLMELYNGWTELHPEKMVEVKF